MRRRVPTLEPGAAPREQRAAAQPVVAGERGSPARAPRPAAGRTRAAPATPDGGGYGSVVGGYGVGSGLVGGYVGAMSPGAWLRGASSRQPLLQDLALFSANLSAEDMVRS